MHLFVWDEIVIVFVKLTYSYIVRSTASVLFCLSRSISLAKTVWLPLPSIGESISRERRLIEQSLSERTEQATVRLRLGRSSRTTSSTPGGKLSLEQLELLTRGLCRVGDRRVDKRSDGVGQVSGLDTERVGEVVDLGLDVDVAGRLLAAYGGSR